MKEVAVDHEAKEAEEGQRYSPSCSSSPLFSTSSNNNIRYRRIMLNLHIWNHSRRNGRRKLLLIMQPRERKRGRRRWRSAHSCTVIPMRIIKTFSGFELLLGPEHEKDKEHKQAEGHQYDYDNRICCCIVIPMRIIIELSGFELLLSPEKEQKKDEEKKKRKEKKNLIILIITSAFSSQWGSS